jgi:hypothetical protein
VPGHVEANRAAIAERIARLQEALEQESLTAFEAVPRVHGDGLEPGLAAWKLQETLCYLRHLEVTGRAGRSPTDDGTERWTALERPAGSPSM